MTATSGFRWDKESELAQLSPTCGSVREFGAASRSHPGQRWGLNHLKRPSPGMGHDDNEDLGSYGATMVAGAIAGMTEHCVMFPIDTIKTRMQVLHSPATCINTGPPLVIPTPISAMPSLAGSATSTMEQIGAAAVTKLCPKTGRPTIPNLQVSLLHTASCAIRTDGITGLYRGVVAAAAGAGPAHAVYFGTYEAMKDRLETITGKPHHHPLVSGTAGALATVASDAVMTPTDVIKQRMQLANSPFRGVLHCVTETLRTGGLPALFRSYSTTLLMNVPFTAVHFAAYESAKEILYNTARQRGEHEEDRVVSTAAAHHIINDNNNNNYLTSTSTSGREGGGGNLAGGMKIAIELAAGAFAGGIASGITTPMDVVKTRLQTDGVMGTALRYVKQPGSSTLGLLPLQTARTIVASEGWSALMGGWKPRVLFHMPSAAICWATYEGLKRFLLAP